MAFLVKKAMKTTINGHAFGVCKVKNRLAGGFLRLYARSATNS
jgi:hypothetical protein